jgi:CDP-diacylglycerol---glycerol-3-phosphate 3-phosphatidyltransferase
VSRATVPWLLRLRAVGVGVAYALAIGFVYAGLVRAWEAGFGAEVEWLVIAGSVGAIEWWFCWRQLGRNRHPESGRLFATLGPGNALTLFRGGCLALAAGFLAVPRPDGPLVWVPVALCALAGVADYADGFAARRSDHETELGAALDIEFDGLGTLIAAALCVHHDQVFVPYLAVGGARYAFVWARAYRRRRNDSLASLPESPTRRRLYVAQFTFSTLALAPLFPRTPLVNLLATAVGGAFLAGFARDWLVVSGRLDP